MGLIRRRSIGEREQEQTAGNRLRTVRSPVGERCLQYLRRAWWLADDKRCQNRVPLSELDTHRPLKADNRCQSREWSHRSSAVFRAN